MIQRRGQFGNAPYFFSSKLWDDYEWGFGDPAKGHIHLSFVPFLSPKLQLGACIQAEMGGGYYSAAVMNYYYAVNGEFLLCGCNMLILRVSDRLLLVM